MVASKLAGYAQGRVGRVARFSVVGAMNTLIDLVVFLALVWWLAVPVVPANLLAFGVALANSYILNRSWTFRDAGTVVSTGNVLRFVLFSCLGAAIATAALWLLSRLGLATLAAKLLSVCVGMCWNYLTMRHLVFAKPR
jgi:putative flippase GtrA